MADTPQSTIPAESQEEFWDCVSLLLHGGGATLVDSDLFNSLSKRKWCACEKNGAEYVRCSQFLHRVVINAGKGTHVDHRNGNGFDNRRSNLRSCNHQQNQWNSRSRAGSASRFKGVCRTTYGPRQAFIRYGGKKHYLGVFDTEEAAARAYDAKAREHHGEFARLNFPEEHDLNR